MATCKAIDAPGQREPWCGLPADPDSIKIAGHPLCSDHLQDYVGSEIASL